MSDIINITVDDSRRPFIITEVGGECRKFYALRQSLLQDSGDSKVRRKWKATQVYTAKIETLWEETRHGFSGMVRIL